MRGGEKAEASDFIILLYNVDRVLTPLYANTRESAFWRGYHHQYL